MACYNCSHLDMKAKKEGKTNGALYYCDVKKNYGSGSDEGCEAHSKDYKRTSYENDEIYNNGRHFSDSNIPLSIYIIIALLLGVVALIASFLT